ncbi:hypothetical protein EGYY_30230 [Eggerthella sp. YY7918]|nr:hypothetical protein EGYY_30230 [Eggerthella sp. YY7918]
MEYASPLLMLGGRLICYKAHVDDEEFQHALDLQSQLGMTLISDRTTTLSDHVRRIICFEKSKKPAIKLPRKAGMALKRPL